MSDRPILIAYDGSVDAMAAITTVGELLTPGPALVVTVWHPAELSAVSYTHLTLPTTPYV